MNKTWPRLSFQEFRAAFLELQEELEVVDKPNDEAMRLAIGPALP